MPALRNCRPGCHFDASDIQGRACQAKAEKIFGWLGEATTRFTWLATVVLMKANARDAAVDDHRGGL